MSPSRQNKSQRKPPVDHKTKRDQGKTDLSNARPIILMPTVMRRWPLPQPAEEGDKEERGRVLVIGGAKEMPGAIILAATAALRAGAGKLQIATCRSIAQLVAAAVPEARVFALPETKTGDIAASAAETIAEHANSVHAVLIGPGMIDEETVTRLTLAILARIEEPSLILDAAALACLKKEKQALHKLKAQVILTPHAGEMASMTGEEKDSIKHDPLAAARRAANELHAVVALKGAETFIAAPSTRKTYCNRTGNVGLATSGSGDTLSGIITGLAARGAAPLQAAAWGVYLHGRAGERLAKRVGQLGFLARELLAEVPSLMAKFDKRQK